jgi:hypothetical protein
MPAATCALVRGWATGSVVLDAMVTALPVGQALHPSPVPAPPRGCPSGEHDQTITHCVDHHQLDSIINDDRQVINN